jgi:hypothetical protein
VKRAFIRLHTVFSRIEAIAGQADTTKHENDDIREATQTSLEVDNYLVLRA